MTEIAFGGAFSQKDPALHPQDIDDCWVVEVLQAARTVGANVGGLTITDVRRAAGRPDDPHKSNPGGAADVLRAVKRLFPTLRVSQSSTNWSTFRAAVVKQGKVAELMVLSDKLAPDHQYGFRGPKSFHAITVRFVATSSGGAWYGMNPLQPKGSRADRYGEAELKAAAEAYPAGVQAVLFAPALPPVPAPVPAPAPGPVPAPVPDPDPTTVDDAYAQGKADGIAAAIDALEALL